jgi:hypothetical protein
LPEENTVDIICGGFLVKDGASTENPRNTGLVMLVRNICLGALVSSDFCSTKEFSTLYET